MKKLTAQQLRELGIPAVLVAGFVAAYTLGWDGKALEKVKNYYEIKQLFPTSGYVKEIEDGDTFTLKSGVKVRLVGINAPERGEKNYEEAKLELSKEIANKKVYIEYDRYQDDKFARVLAWVWVGCELTPQFAPSDYMHKSGNESNPGLTENPKGCKKGNLVNEELVKKKLAEPVSYKERGPLKYEGRISN